MTQNQMKIVCSKERELGIMATQIKNIEITVNKIDKKLDELPKIYATKQELTDVKNSLISYDTVQDHKLDFVKNNWFSLLVVLALIIYGILKSRNLI